MLVVDGVELAVSEQLLHVWRFDHRHAAGVQQHRDPLHEPVQVRDMGQHVVGVDHIRSHAFGPEGARELAAEELAPRADAAALGYLRDVSSGLDAKHAHPCVPVVLEQIAVVARHLHDQAVRAERFLAHQA